MSDEAEETKSAKRLITSDDLFSEFEKKSSLRRRVIYWIITAAACAGSVILILWVIEGMIDAGFLEQPEPIMIPVFTHEEIVRGMMVGIIILLVIVVFVILVLICIVSDKR